MREIPIWHRIYNPQSKQEYEDKLVEEFNYIYTFV